MKPYKVTFEDVSHHLPEGYFEQYTNPEDNQYLQEEFEKRIRRVNRPLGKKSAAVLNRRSSDFQKVYVALKNLSEEQSSEFIELCKEVEKTDKLIGSYNRETAYSKIASKYNSFIDVKLLVVCRKAGINSKILYLAIPMQSFALEISESLKNYYLYSDLL